MASPETGEASQDEPFAQEALGGPVVARALHVTLLATAVALLTISLIALGIFLSAKQSDAALSIDAILTTGPSSESTTLEEALRILSTKDEKLSVIDTDRSEAPFWIRGRLDAKRIKDNPIFDLPSRHMVEFELWFLTPDGVPVFHTRGDRTNINSQLVRRSDSGIAVTIPASDADHIDFVAKIRSVGPTKISARLWTPQAFEAHLRAYERIGGILIGGLTLFGLFSAIIAFRTQQAIFILFTGWLVTTLGVASLSSGHMHTWGGEYLPNWLQIFPRKAFIAVCAVYSTALFRALFYHELHKLKLTRLADLALYLAVGLSVLSAIASMEHFLPAVWITTGAGAMLLIWCLDKIVRTGSVSAKWFAWSWIANFAGTLAEIAYAMGLVPSLPPALNNVGGAVMAALLMGAALSEQMKVDKARRQVAEKQAVDALASYKAMYNRNAMAMCRLDQTGTIVQFNPAFESLVRSCGHEVSSSREIDDLLGSDLAATLLRRANDGRQKFELEWVFKDRNGNSRWLSISGTTDAEYIETAALDITDRKIAENTLRHLAEHDYLTGLPNRRALENWVNKWQSEGAHDACITVTYLDLDRFKLINDLFGHSSGDEVLKEVSARIRANVPQDAIACRVGGDEFVILHLSGDHELAASEAKKLVDAIATTTYAIQGGNKAVSVTCSAGVISSDRSIDFRDILATADAACHEAKSSGRRHVIAYHHSSQQVRGKIAEIRFLEDLKDHLPKDRLRLFLQPIANTDLSVPLSAESLVRMIDAQGRLIHPTQFVSIAERNGMMSNIDYWVLQEAIAWLNKATDSNFNLNWLSVNFSGTSLNDEYFIAQTCDLLKANARAASRICIEVTESSALVDLNYSKRILERFQDLGCRVALDDFGAGYTSFSYLTQLSASILKIDGGFIKDIATRPENRAITGTIMRLAKDLKMETVAEWVETPELLEATVSMGANYIQGYLVSKPIPADMFQEQATVIHQQFARVMKGISPRKEGPDAKSSKHVKSGSTH